MKPGSRHLINDLLEKPANLPAATKCTAMNGLIDERNRTERMVIGFGLGRSDVRALAQVHAAGVTKPVLEIEVDAKSGLKPGVAAAGPMGLTAVVVNVGLGVVSEAASADVVADADRAASGISKQLANYFGQQGWTQ